MTADLGKWRNLKPEAKHVFEVLETIKEEKTEVDKVKSIRLHLEKNLPFKHLMMWAFLVRIESVLPPGEPPFRKNEEDGDSHKLWEFIKMLPYFVKSAKSMNMKMLKIERIFIDMLEAIPYQEAQVVLAVKDKNVIEKYPFLKKEWFYHADPVVFKECEPVAKIEEKVEVSAPETPIVEEKKEEQPVPKALEADKEALKSEIVSEETTPVKAPAKKAGKTKATKESAPKTE